MEKPHPTQHYADEWGIPLEFVEQAFELHKACWRKSWEAVVSTKHGTGSTPVPQHVLSGKYVIRGKGNIDIVRRAAQNLRDQAFHIGESRVASLIGPDLEE